MGGTNFVFCLVIVFLPGELSGLLEDHCTDLSYYEEIEYITTTKQCCKPKLKQFCEDKSQEVCKDVLEVQCEPLARVECESQTALATGKKCEVDFKRYDYKDCNKKVTTRVDCRQNSVESCKPKLKIYDDGRAVLTDEITCTSLLYEDCLVVDDAVSGCSRDELQKLCSCAHDYDPVCAGGILFDNICLHECAKKEAECADVQGIPAVGDIAECVDDPETKKGLVNRNAIKEFKKTLLDIETELSSLTNSRSRWEGLGYSEDEFKLLNSIVNAKMYLEIECSNEKGKCDVGKIKVYIEELKLNFNAVKATGRVSPGFMQSFVPEREKFVVVADVSVKVQEKTALKRPPQENAPYLVTVLLELDGLTVEPLGRSSDSRVLSDSSGADSVSPPACATPFHIKWTDFVEKQTNVVEQTTSCEVKSSVVCKRVSVNKCTTLDWKECSLRPVQECQDVPVSQPSQEKVHRKKCLLKTVCPADVAVTKDCMCAGKSCPTGNTCVGGTTCTAGKSVCPADVAVTKDCMCAGKSCATGSTCVGGSTCTAGKSVTCPYKDDLSSVLLENNWRTQNQINLMSYEDKRNTVIVEVEQMTGHTITDLQGRDDVGDLESLISIANMAALLIKYSIRSSSDVKSMTYEPHLRNTLIVEASQRFSIQVSELQSMTDPQLLKTFCTDSSARRRGASHGFT